HTRMTKRQSAIEVENLVKVYQTKNRGPLRAVDGISFSVRQGEIFGLLGPNGAGKSTTIKILTTLVLPTSGSARILGHDVVTQPLEVRRQICVVVQENAIELYLSVRNNFRTFGKFHGLSTREVELRGDRVSELFGLREHLGEKGSDLSGGLKRRVQVAKMFLIDKPIVFLDEATTGMDTFNKRATVAAIKEESRKGRTVILTTHMLDEAEELCASLAIVNHGKVIASGSTDQVKSLGLKLLYLTLSFDKVTQRTLKAIQRAKPVKIEVRDATVEVTVREEDEALKILNTAKRLGSLKQFEITSASLEDAFVEMIDKKAGAP
ncbi:MAG: ABC transporter ATP-binding protein, partial [Bacteroidota bacterium]